MSMCLISDNDPTEPIVELSEARVANPMIVVLRRVALMQHVGDIFNHEFALAEFTMVVIPARILGPPISAMGEVYAGQILLLPVQSPVVHSLLPAFAEQPRCVCAI
jgi:hypothetical protein